MLGKFVGGVANSVPLALAWAFSWVTRSRFLVYAVQPTVPPLSRRAYCVHLAIKALRASKVSGAVRAMARVLSTVVLQRATRSTFLVPEARLVNMFSPRGRWQLAVRMSSLLADPRLSRLARRKATAAAVRQSRLAAQVICWAKFCTIVEVCLVYLLYLSALTVSPRLIVCGAHILLRIYLCRAQQRQAPDFTCASHETSNVC